MRLTLPITLAFAAALVGCGNSPNLSSTGVRTQADAETMETQARRRDLETYARQGLKLMMARLDTNGDGALTLGEIPQSMIDRHDLNADGRVTFDEIATPKTVSSIAASLKSMTERIFPSLDTNNDKRIGFSELRSLQLGNENGFLPDPEPTKWEHFRMADKNQDGVLSRAELEHWFGSLFSKGYGMGAAVPPVHPAQR